MRQSTQAQWASCLAGLVCAGAAQAQTSAVSGHIINDCTGFPVEGALVELQRDALGGSWQTRTDANGDFEIAQLEPGAYSFEVWQEDYSPLTALGLWLSVDRPLHYLLRLHRQGYDCEDMVWLPRPTVATTSGTGAVVTSDQLALIPYGRSARTFEAAFTSAPNVQSDLYGPAINGASSPETAISIDGVRVTDPVVGTQATTLLQDFVQEIDVKTGGFTAEYGHASGGVINVVTKSGSNTFHGSLFANLSPFEAARAQVAPGGTIGGEISQRYTFDAGFTLGGPILKDRLWFFAGLAPQVQALNFDRTILARIDDGTGRAKVDPATGSPLTAEVARQRYANTTTAWLFTGKLTLAISDDHSLSLSVFGNPTHSTGAQTLGAQNEGSALFDTQNGSLDASLRYLGKLFAGSTLLEFTGALHHQLGGAESPNQSVVDVQGKTASQLRDTPAIGWRQHHNLLDPALDDGLSPASQRSPAVAAACALHANGFDPCPVLSYATGGLGYLGHATLDRLSASLKLSQRVDLLGRHWFKLGAGLSRDTSSLVQLYTGGAAFEALGDPAPTTFGGRGFGHVNPNNPGVPARDPMRPGHLEGDELASTARSFTMALFAQDTLTLADRVVLDVGVRSELQRLSGDPGTLDSVGLPAPGLQLFNLMPRLGLAYDFTGVGSSRVYAFYGRTLESIPLLLAQRGLSSGPSVTYAANPARCTDPRDPRTCTVIAGGQDGRTYSFAGTTARLAVDPDLRGQYDDRLQGGASYQVHRGVVLAVDYVHQQLGRAVEDLTPDGGSTSVLTNPGDPGLGAQAASGVAFVKPRRVYDALTVSLNKTFADQWLFNVSYTYSALRGTTPGLFRPETGELQPNLLSDDDLAALSGNRSGRLPGDRPHALKAEAARVIELTPALALTLGGAFRMHQGGPTSYLGATAPAGAFDMYILPRGLADRLPWLWQLDLRAALACRLTATYTLGATLDVFNVTDNRGVTGVDQRYTFDGVSPILNGTVADLAFLKNTSGQPVTRNPGFQVPTSYQLPLAARLGAKLSF